MSINQSDYNPSLRFETRDLQTWTSGLTHTVTDARVTSRSLIVLVPTVVSEGHWSVVASNGSFTVTSTNDETGKTFYYLIF